MAHPNPAKTAKQPAISRAMTVKQALAFIERHGVVLEAARGPVPSLAEKIAGSPISGSWWGHPKGREIWRISQSVRDSKEILVCRLIDGKVTYVHRRLWPALVRLAARLGKGRLAAIREVHLPAGRHEVRVAPFPLWVPIAVVKEAKRLDEATATAQLGRWLDPDNA